MLPAGTVTLLMGDVESSTGLWQQDATRAIEARAELDAVVERCVAEHDGVRPLEQGEGDSFVAAFTKASDALACALDIQRRSADGVMRYRIGIHTGEALIDDGRYEGTTIIRAARVRDLGHGGQVLVTSSTRDLVIDVVPDGCDLLDLGSHELKGLDRPEQVHQLTHPDLQPVFPALRGGSARTILRKPLTSFVGRTEELAAIEALLGSERLVTLAGAGGCGKTRLAIEIVGRIGDDYPDGAWFCDLSAVTEPSSVVPTLCGVVGARTESHPSDVEALLARLRSAKAIVVVDNCEHLIAECAEVAESILAACPDVTILATSRETLGVHGEVAWRVPSLEAPKLGEAVSLDGLSVMASVRLFVERAERVRPGFVLSAGNAVAVADICARLDGIPLAIELAAARVRVLSPGQISEGLSDRFRMLGRGARTLLPRQQTLEASVAWSYGLLSEQQRVVFERAAIFGGGFTLEAAEGITSGDSVTSPEVLELVTQLVDRSLLVVDEKPHGIRYRMLETIRQYARERLIDSGEVSAVSLAHLRWYESWVRALLRTILEGADVDHTFDLLEDEYENVRVAVEYAIATHERTSGLRLLSPLTSFLGVRTVDARFRETTAWLSELLEGAGDIDDRVRAGGLIALSFVSSMLGDWSTMGPAVKEALDVSREIGPSSLLARALWLAGVHQMTVDPHEAVPLLEESAEVAKQIGDIATFSYATGHLCQTFSLLIGDHARGLTLANEIIGPSRAFYVGVNLMMTGEVREGVRLLQQAHDGYVAQGNSYWTSVALGELAFAAFISGEVAEAVRLARRSLDIGEGTGYNSFFAVFVLFEAACREGAFDLASSHLDRFFEQMVPMSAEARPFLAFGLKMARARAHARIALLGGDVDAARLEASSLRDDPLSSMGIFAMLEPLAALLERSAGETVRAEGVIADALERIATSRRFIDAPDALDIAAAVRADAGGHADAVRLFAASYAARARMGTVPMYRDVFDLEAEKAVARARLGDDAFDQSWQEGAVLSLDDALAFALRGRGPRQRPRSGWDSITPTERQVIDLVTEGLTNPQIAQKLIMSKRTVSTHLSHVFAKLGVASRAELAAATVKRKG